jgi:hypothetical protein
MRQFKKLIILFLTILLSSQYLVLDSKAFFVCKRNQCNKKIDFTLQNFNLDEINPNNSTESSVNDVTNPGGGADNPGGGADIPGGGADIPGGGGNDDFAKNKACSVNNQKLSNAISYLKCQFDTAEYKARQIIRSVNNLNNKLFNLLDIMRRAPVCTNLGYTEAEFAANHSIVNNLQNLINFLNSMIELEKKLDKIKLTCENCHDEAALNAALDQVNAIQAQLDNLKADFNNEIDNIKDRINNFIIRVQEVINLHSITVPGIMFECGVNRNIATSMRRARFRVIAAFNRFKNSVSNIFDSIDDVNFNQHDCIFNQNIDEKLVMACVGLR